MGLDMNSVLSEEEVSALFSTGNITPDEETHEKKEDSGVLEAESVEDIFSVNKDADEDNKEDSTKEENIKESEDTLSDSDKVHSDKSPVFSSIALALKEYGVLTDLDENDLEKVSTPEEFAELFNKELHSRLDETQKRINEAMDAGVEANDIRNYEKAIEILNSINEDDLTQESDKGDSLRRKVICQYYLNKGFNNDEALSETEKSFKAGTDVDDAKKALLNNKKFFQDEYNQAIEEAKQEKERIISERNKQAGILKKSLLETEEIDGIRLSNSVRKAAYECLTKPVYKDEDGRYYNAIQKYELDDRTDFLKKLGLVFTLTDGFKSFDKLLGSKVRKETGKKMKELEKVLFDPSRGSFGKMSQMGLSSESERKSSMDGYILDIPD